MRSIIFLCGLLLLTALTVSAAAPPAGTKAPQNASAIIDNLNWIDANRLLMFVGNTGNFAYDAGQYFGKNDGLYYPYSNVEFIQAGILDNTVIFDAGIWIGGKDGDSVFATVAEYSTEFVPGPMSGGTFTPDGPNFRVFKLYRDSLWDNPNQDYLDYITHAVPLGADYPWREDTLRDSLDNIIGIDTVQNVPGDQYMWSVYNDADPSQHNNDAGATPPLGLEIQQSAFAFTRDGSLGNIVFLKFKILNKGNRHLDSTFVSIWSDPDLGNSGDDLVGCDTSRLFAVDAQTGESLFVTSLGFCYNDGDDNVYGANPPAVGFDFFQGPLEQTGNMADTAIMWGKTWPGYRNLPMSSFNKYINGTDPGNYTQTYNYMRGLERDGAPYVYSGDTTKYFVSGDPVEGSGDIDVSPADRRLMLTTGPFEFDPGDSTEVVCAVVVGQGGDPISSITVMRQIDIVAQKIYDAFFETAAPPAKPVVEATQLGREIILKWGQDSEMNPGDYTFEGYGVLQKSSASDQTFDTLAYYDVINGMAIASDFFFDANLGKPIERAVKPGRDKGLKRYYEVTEDKSNGGRLVDYTQYYFRIEAYSVDTTQPQGDRILTSFTDIVVTPQPTTPGTELSAVYGDSLADSLITHDGASDGAAKVFIVDPTALTGHDYKVAFTDTSWMVIDVTTNDTVVPYWTNQSDVEGADNYPVVDGMLIKVFGAANDFKSFEVVANGAGAIDPPAAGAFEFADFPVPLDDEGHPLRPDDGQQVGDGLWGIHTADNGGSEGGGTRGLYDAFISRTTRDGANWPYLIPNDFEIRFTGSNSAPGVNGSYVIEWFNDDNVFWVPFEVWNTGVGTPDDPSDDYQMICYIIDDGEDNIFALESWGDPTTGGGDLEHSVSGGTNDPYTDWIYFQVPNDKSPGTAGYDAAETAMLSASYDGSQVEHEALARIVLVNWNGGSAPPFNQDCPEQGTVFRIITTKPNSPSDSYTFTATAAPTLAKSEAALSRIKAVPNPYYLYSSYDNDTFRRQIRFTNLPQQCTITIFDLSGSRIAQVEKNSPDTWAAWDVQNFEGIPIASGIYIYVVDAPGYGQKTGKVAVFTEEEQLDNY